jgi:hypothetical protein
LMRPLAVNEKRFFTPLLVFILILGMGGAEYIRLVGQCKSLVP